MRAPKRDLSGLRFGRWLVVRFHERVGPAYFWWCQCDCGNARKVISTRLNAGKSLSCGCSHMHGYVGTRIYNIWGAMRTRCNCKSDYHYPRYGGRGIRVCDRWNDFRCFLADMGEPPEGMSIDRIDNNGDYEPSNCRWATNKEQQRNRRDNRRVIYLDETCTVKEWAEHLGMKYNTLLHRLDRGWPVDQAMTKPPAFSYDRQNDRMVAAEQATATVPDVA